MNSKPNFLSEILEQSSSDQIDFSGLGKGVNAYHYHTPKANSAFNSHCQQVKGYNTNDFTSEVTIINSYEELYAKTCKKTGLAIDLGFLTVCHKKQNENNFSLNSNTALLSIKSKRVASNISLNIGEFDSQILESAKKMDKLDFYKNFGAFYISSVQTGYYAEIYLWKKCDNASEARVTEKILKERLITESLSTLCAKTQGSNYDESLASYCTEHNISFEMRHNLPADQIESGQLLDLSSNLQKLALVETLPTDNCHSIINHTLSEYPHCSDASYAFKDATINKLFEGNFQVNPEHILSQYKKCLDELDKIDTYRNAPHAFVTCNGADQIYRYYSEKLDCYRSLFNRLNENPWLELDPKINNYKRDPTFNLECRKTTITEIFNDALKESTECGSAKVAVKSVFESCVKYSQVAGIKGHWSVMAAHNNNKIKTQSHASCLLSNGCTAGGHHISATFEGVFAE